MKMSEVDFKSPVFRDHPLGWQSPSDVVAGFSLAWALEIKERMKLSPFDPFAIGVADRLPDPYRYDTLGKLIERDPGSSGTVFGQAPVIRLTTLCGAWQLFDELNSSWRLRPNDFAQMAEAMSFVTGGTDRPSLYRDLSANFGKCLISVRVRRAFSQQDELDVAERWFVTGDGELTSKDQQGYDSLLFQFGPSPVQLALVAHEFVEGVWSTARVLVDRLGPDRVIAQHRDRIESVSDLLVRGAEKAAEAKKQMSPIQFRFFNYWPGWS